MIEFVDPKFSKVTLEDGEELTVPSHYVRFARIYALTNKRSKAYREMFAKEEGETDNQCVASSAFKIAQREDVIKLVEYFRNKFDTALDISESRILAELAACGLYRVTDALDSDGQVLKPDEMPSTIARALQSYKCKSTTDQEGNPITQTEVVFANKISALKTIAEIKGMGKINESGATTVIINKASMTDK